MCRDDVITSLSIVTVRSKMLDFLSGRPHDVCRPLHRCRLSVALQVCWTLNKYFYLTICT